MKKNYFIALYFSLAFWPCLLGVVATSCSGDHARISEFHYVDESYDWGLGPLIDFVGIHSVDEVSDTTARLTWEGHQRAETYFIYVREGELAAWEVVEAVTKDHTSYVVRGLHPETTYSFMVKALNDQGVMDPNHKFMTIHTNLAPNAPRSVTLKFPKSPVMNMGFAREPIFTVGGVKPGETVRLFKNDHTCAEAAEFGSAVVAEDQTAVEITSNDLGLSVDRYTFFANTTNTAGHTSPCSIAFATYYTVACPDDSYVSVESNAELGTTAFCVMKTEAKNNGNDIPVATYDGMPWVSIHADEAKAACQSIVVEGGSCDLISNPQWMTLAREIEAVDANWSTGEVGNGQLNIGHTDNWPAGTLTISDPTNPWTGTMDDEAVWSQKRTHQLANGEVIWDLSGNVYEWVDWITGGDTFSLGPNTCPDSWAEPYQCVCPDLAPNDYLPGNPAEIDPAIYNSDYGLGMIRGTREDVQEAGEGGAALRGGNYYSWTGGGIFYLLLNYSRSTSSSTFGFRCTCLVRPTP